MHSIHTHGCLLLPLRTVRDSQSKARDFGRATLSMEDKIKVFPAVRTPFPSLPCLLLIAIAPDLTSIVDVGESSDWRTPFSSAFVVRRAKAVPGVHITRRYSLPISRPPRKCVICCTRCSDPLSHWVCIFASILPSFMTTV